MAARIPARCFVLAGVHGFARFLRVCVQVRARPKSSETVRVRFLCHLPVRTLRSFCIYLHSLTVGPLRRSDSTALPTYSPGGCSQCHCAGRDRSGLLAWRARALRRVPRILEVGKRVKGERRSGNGSVNAERQLGFRTLCGAVSRPLLPDSELRLESGQLLLPRARPQLREQGGGRTEYPGSARWDCAPSIQAAETYDLLFRPASRRSVGGACLL